MTTRSLARRATLLLGATAIALVLAAPCFAQAQAPSTQELLEQIKLLQKRIEQLEAADKARQQGNGQVTRAATAQQPAAAPKAAAAAPAAAPQQQQVTSTEVVVAPPSTDPAPAPAAESNKPDGTFMLGGAKLTLGGFVDLTSYYRSKNDGSATLSSFNRIPFYGPTPQGNSGAFGMSAQQTRLSGKLEGTVSPDEKLMGYIEVDFLNGSGGASNVQSNSYTPRLRQAFAQYDNSSWQAYVLAGQAWTLATPFKKGLDSLQTWQPPTLDNNYVVGYDYLRVPMLRAVKGFGNFWVGVEANTPQTVFGGTASVPAGQTVFTGYPGSSGLNPQTNYSVNVAPDLIAKIAVDTSFGHFDAFGVARWFRNQLSLGTTSVNYNAFGGGFGASAYIPVGKRFDLMGSVMYGNGIGRYGAGGLPDVTFKPNGGVTTLPQGMGLVGGIAQLIPDVLSLYGYYGWNWVGASYFPGGGYGNPGFNNSGCFNANANGANCAGNTQTLTELTFGLNWNVLKGRYGTFRTGVQYGHITRTAYWGVGGKPSTAEDLIMFNVRYIPFD